MFKQFGQGLAGVFTHQVIQMLALAGRVHLGKTAARHTTQKPLFKQQALRVRVLVATGGQGFE
ncbi:hypothetical protein D3C76_1454040 [compost metagenome]